MFTLETRSRISVITDPQRRVYNGCAFSSKEVWTEWDWLGLNVKPSEVKRQLNFWRELNKVSATKREYRMVTKGGRIYE